MYMHGAYVNVHVHVHTHAYVCMCARVDMRVRMRVRVQECRYECVCEREEESLYVRVCECAGIRAPMRVCAYSQRSNPSPPLLPCAVFGQLVGPAGMLSEGGAAGNPGGHYQLLAHIASQLRGALIVEMGSMHGASALVLLMAHARMCDARHRGGSAANADVQCQPRCSAV